MRLPSRTNTTTPLANRHNTLNGFSNDHFQSVELRHTCASLLAQIQQHQWPTATTRHMLQPTTKFSPTAIDPRFSPATIFVDTPSFSPLSCSSDQRTSRSQNHSVLGHLFFSLKGYLAASDRYRCISVNARSLARVYRHG